MCLNEIIYAVAVETYILIRGGDEDDWVVGVAVVVAPSLLVRELLWYDESEVWVLAGGCYSIVILKFTCYRSVIKIGSSDDLLGIIWGKWWWYSSGGVLW